MSGTCGSHDTHCWRGDTHVDPYFPWLGTFLFGFRYEDPPPVAGNPLFLFFAFWHALSYCALPVWWRRRHIFPIKRHCQPLMMTCLVGNVTTAAICISFFTFSQPWTCRGNAFLWFFAFPNWTTPVALIAYRMRIQYQIQQRLNGLKELQQGKAGKGQGTGRSSIVGMASVEKSRKERQSVGIKSSLSVRISMLKHQASAIDSQMLDAHTKEAVVDPQVTQMKEQLRKERGKIKTQRLMKIQLYANAPYILFWLIYELSLFQDINNHPGGNRTCSLSSIHVMTLLFVATLTLLFLAKETWGIRHLKDTLFIRSLVICFDLCLCVPSVGFLWWHPAWWVMLLTHFLVAAIPTIFFLIPLAKTFPQLERKLKAAISRLRKKSSKVASVLLSSQQSAAMNPQALYEVLDSGKRLDDFKEFCVRSLCVENVEFYMAVVDYMSLFKEIEQERDKIFTTHVHLDADMEVNVPSDVSELTRGREFQPLNINDFDEAQTVIFKLMQSDSWPRFKKDLGKEGLQPPDDFMSVLLDEFLLFKFKEHCKAAFSSENIEFYLEVANYRGLVDESFSLKRTVYETFINNEAMMKVKVSPEDKTQLMVVQNEHPKSKDFSGPQNQIYKLLDTDVWPRFVAEFKIQITAREKTLTLHNQTKNKTVNNDDLLSSSENVGKVVAENNEVSAMKQSATLGGLDEIAEDEGEEEWG